MNSIQNELNPTLARLSPLLITIILIFYHIINPFYVAPIYLNVMFGYVKILNWILKNIIFNPIYTFANVSELPIIGKGIRPTNAKYCNYVLSGNLSTSFGMPSGHSQIAWAIAFYLLCKYFIIIRNLLDNKNEHNTKIIIKIIWCIILCISIIIIAIYISYSRVHIDKCHTIQQVIVGGIIGIVCGFIIYYFEDDVLELMRKNLNLQ